MSDQSRRSCGREQRLARGRQPLTSVDQRAEHLPCQGNWLDKLLQACKLTLSAYEEYLYKCRDGLAHRKRNLDLLKASEEKHTLEREVEERTKALRSDPSLYQPFKEVPEAVARLASSQPPRLRYFVLVARA